MISILFPSRGRPYNIERMVSSARDLAANPDDLQFCIYVDEDDLTSFDMAESIGIERIRVGPRILLSEMWNKVHEVASGPIYMHAGDDIIFRTKQWDQVVRETFDASTDKIIFVHGRDGYWEERFGTHGFLHENWVETVGYFVPPYFSSDYNDQWLNDVADALDRRVFVEILTEHMHPNFGKGELDQTHIDRLNRGAKDNVEQLYQDLAPKREEDVQKLRDFITGYNEENR